MNKIVKDILEVLSLPILVGLIVFGVFGMTIYKVSWYIGNKIIDLLELEDIK